MSRLLYILGVLTMIALGSTMIVLLLKRAYPEIVAINFLGPLLSIVGVLIFVRILWPRR